MTAPEAPHPAPSLADRSAAPVPVATTDTRSALAGAVEDRMAAYYQQRAAYYERVYFKPERQADLRALEAWMPEPFAGRQVLEIACGTGWWTPHGATRAATWLATDLNPDTLAVARAKALPACVSFRTIDAYTLDGLTPDEPFDAAFAGCWWSHVPLQRLPSWLALLHSRLRPGARVVMLDNRYVPGSSTPLARADTDGNTFQLRTLDDGSTHEVLKNFPTEAAAIATVAAAASAQGRTLAQAHWRPNPHYWVLDYTLV